MASLSSRQVKDLTEAGASLIADLNEHLNLDDHFVTDALPWPDPESPVILVVTRRTGNVVLAFHMYPKVPTTPEGVTTWLPGSILVTPLPILPGYSLSAVEEERFQLTSLSAVLAPTRRKPWTRLSSFLWGAKRAYAGPHWVMVWLGKGMAWTVLIGVVALITYAGSLTNEIEVLREAERVRAFQDTLQMERHNNTMAWDSARGIQDSLVTEISELRDSLRSLTVPARD